MSQTERLREALLEIELLRNRERKTLQETRALLEVLRLTTEKALSGTALKNALQVCAEHVGGVGAAIVRLSEDAGVVETSTEDTLEGASLAAPPHFFHKHRIVTDVARVPALSEAGLFEEMGVSSLLSATDLSDTEQARTLMCWHPAPHKFSKAHLQFLKRAMHSIVQSSRTAALARQNALLAAVIDGSSSGFSIADASDDTLPLMFVNKAFETLTGYSARDVEGQNCRFLAADPVDGQERVKLRAALKARGSGRFLLRNRRKDGSLFWNDLALFPVRDDTGSTTHMVATQTDATERVKAEVETRKLQSHLQNVLDHTRDAFVMVMFDGTVAFANDGTRAMFGSDRLGWQPGTSFADNWSAYIDGFSHMTDALPAELTHPDLTELAKQDAGVRTSLPDGRQVLFRAQNTDHGAIVVSATDTTAIRTTERLLAQRAAAVENASDGIAILDDAGRITYANSALGRLVGAQHEQKLLGRIWTEMYEKPEGVEQLRAEIGVRSGADIFMVRGSGEKIYHEVSCTEVDRVGEVMVVRDVTQALGNRHRLSELNKQIEDARRREAISNLAAGLAHDFNNVLSAIAGSAALMETDPDATDEIKGHAARISKAGVAAARLVNRMLDLGSAGDDASVFDLRAILAETEALATTNLSKETVFTLDPGRSALNIRASAQDITLVLLNLVINAHDALPNGHGAINVVLSHAAISTNRSPLQGKIVPGQAYAQMSVLDTGSGMTDDVMNNVFEPFFTTKGTRGTGAGLAMVSAIVKRLDGAIYIDSTPGEGTRFDILLPLLNEGAKDMPDPSIAPDLAGQTILVLDDQHDVGSVTAAYLENCGAEVSVLDDPALAVEVICEDPTEWNALITDYDMPGMTGGDVVEKITGHSPDFPILVVTALARRLSDPRINERNVRGVFAKPANLGQLARAVKDLDRPS